MNDFFVYFLIAIAALILGIFLGNYIARLKSSSKSSTLLERARLGDIQVERLNQHLEKENKKLESIRSEKENLGNELIKQNTAYENLKQRHQEQKEEINQLQEKFKKEFENLANKILADNTKKLTDRNKENLESVLNPLKERIKDFEKKVDSTNKESLEKHTELKVQINGLMKLNEQMSLEAVNLTNALKGDSKIQGDWGETQLEVLLEKAGLQDNVHYSKQGGFRDKNDSLKKPDFIINLPDNRHLIVDSKVSLTAYEGYFNAENDEDKSMFLKKHIDSIRQHIKDLGNKRYSELYGINTPDYVLMFVPIEPALFLALNNKEGIFLGAMDKNVVLVSNSTLLATLSTVSSIWKHEDQKQNVQEIVRQATNLYEKFTGLIEDLNSVGVQMNKSKKSYEDAMNKLHLGRGNLINRIEGFKKLGIKPSKQIPNSNIQRAKESGQEEE